ncbi:DNA (cytosine-5-)-methyltransferase [Chitinophaga caeni]|uniref:DNA (cytosine-5-)-methyltransferase n=1 Tax=Chitinophaga caeni TaxID=2029983 RepID=A0A291QQA7_9BACT|nr:DNA cytosine methyltransferase [Chitinophaga caeni]ATL46140.1 DNA (cytosine-5-)-methyltransferase [Chitinophaga caeni]
MSVKFYLDKADKRDCAPIHLVLRHKSVQIKVATGEKVHKSEWDPQSQLVDEKHPHHKEINRYLFFLKEQVIHFMDTAAPAQLTEKKLKVKILSFVKGRKANNDKTILPATSDFEKGKQKFTFLDLFAGAGGFSEGFLQAQFKDKIFDFLLASDINENCELTHLARYNYQLGLDVAFLRQDISEPGFLDNLVKSLDGKTVDVVCGGPPCQSFSLAGKRSKFDKKDELFAHYLKVIRQLRPKYFVMENVKGILTKERGKIKEMILQEIRSIIDLNDFHILLDFIKRLGKQTKKSTFLLNCYLDRLQFETAIDKELDELKSKYILLVEKKFKQLTPKIVSYKESKTSIHINTIRHGFKLLERSRELTALKKRVIHEKSSSDLDNDLFVGDFNAFLTAIDPGYIIERIQKAFQFLSPSKEYKADVDELLASLKIYTTTFDDCMQGLKPYVKEAKASREFEQILNQIRLYNIEEPFVAHAADYGVPQNRERVLFIGCRKDQSPVKEVPPTVSAKERVTVFEALHDLDFINMGEEKFQYEEVDLKAKYNGSSKVMAALLKKRDLDGSMNAKSGLSYSDWSKKGRLSGRFPHAKHPFFVKHATELSNIQSHFVAPLLNHKTSKQNSSVVKRLEVILQEGDYDLAKKRLRTEGLASDKRSYNVLKPNQQSPTVVTIPDDYIHYASPRALTVREMARLQSFDDSFVFQGKRATGGIKRKMEVPQFTLVGNAVPPLLARAVAQEILKHIH